MSTRNEQNVYFLNIYCIMKFEGLKIDILFPIFTKKHESFT